MADEREGSAEVEKSNQFMSCNLLRMMNVFLLVLVMVKPLMRMGVTVSRALELILLEHAKPIRVALTYYLCTHEEIQLLLPAIHDIARQHGINLLNYAPTRYTRSSN